MYLNCRVVALIRNSQFVSIPPGLSNCLCRCIASGAGMGWGNRLQVATELNAIGVMEDERRDTTRRRYKDNKSFLLATQSVRVYFRLFVLCLT